MITVCPNCSSTNTRIFVSKAHDRQYNVIGSWDYLKCQDCDIVFISPFPKSDQISMFYPNNENYYAYNKQSIPRAYKIIQDYGKKSSLLRRIIIQLLFPLINFERTNCILDVGCGVGHFLDSMKSIGCDTYGIDINEKALEIAKKKHKVFTSLTDIGLEKYKNYFDFVTLFQSIEHLPNPHNDLNLIYQLLKHGGKCVISTPNIGSKLAIKYGKDWRGLEPPRHLILFNKNESTAKRVCSV